MGGVHVDQVLYIDLETNMKILMSVADPDIVGRIKADA